MAGVYPIHDPTAAFTHHRDLIAQRDRERTTRALRRQARERRLMRRADDRRAADLAERLV
jgi:hypothetical protein